MRPLRFAVLGLSLLGGAGCARAPTVDLAKPLRAMVRSEHHAELQWPAFSDFQPEVERLYERVGWKPLWLHANRPTEAAGRLIARLAASDSLGLDPSDYDGAWLGRTAAELESSHRTPTSTELSQFDLGLSVAAVRFVSALHRGRVSPRVVQAQLFVPRSLLAIEMVVDSLRDAGRQEALLEHVQPQLHHYQLLKNGLARYRALARDTSLSPLPGMVAEIKPGTPLASASGLRQVLEALGDLPERGAPPDSAGASDSPDLVAAVKRFQVRHGIEPDGVIGPATATALRRPIAQRVAQIELALERFRWLPPTFVRPPIIVNIPAFRLYAFRGATDDEDEMLAMDVVVGGAFDKRTPVFAAEMKYLIFRPYWEVPVSIMREELGPRAVDDPAWLAREHMVLVRSEGDNAEVLPATSGNLARIGEELRVRQLPGPENALGLVKFMLPNAHDIYLHDTAAKGLFARSRRDLSHGCIRLSDPVALAVHVLRDQPGWTPQRIREAMEGKDNQRVDLSGPVPVCIVYATALARENGDVYFYPDIYELDAELERLLRVGYPYPR